MTAQTISHFEKNTEGNDYVVGDIHGMYDQLCNQLSGLSFNTNKDRLFSVGDLVDRGPESWHCLNLIYKDWFFSVLGNHEDMMFRGMVDGDAEHYQCWMMNGGTWAIDLMDGTDTFEFALRDMRNMFPLAIEVETDSGMIGIVHGDAPMFWSPSLIELENHTLWGRKRITDNIESVVKDIDHVYVGHTPLEKITTLGNVTYLDTGAVFGNNRDLSIIQIN
jgi:serine/threonine protein phosphatase 1